MIIEKILTPNKFSRPQLPIGNIKALVIHYVANPNSTALQNIAYWENRKKGKDSYGSAHIVVDLDGKVYQAVPFTEKTYHAGDAGGAYTYKPIVKEKLGGAPNTNSIGIECCHTNTKGEMTKATYDKLVLLSTYLLKKFDLYTSDHLLLHGDIVDKNCHKWFIDNPIKWLKFKKEVDSCLLQYKDVFSRDMINLL